MINALTIQETIIFVGLFLGLLLSLGTAFIDASISNLKHPRDLLYAVFFHVLFQWICAVAIFAFVGFWIYVIAVFLSS